MKRNPLALVLVAALGYFVDIFDLALFGIVRIQSLQDLGLSSTEILTEGVRLLNMQMIGLLLGGLVWGVLGDKYGRLKVLFGSILLYSLANLANAYVETSNQYAWLRFLAGIGLAGELGAAITLIAETLPTEKRGYGTALVAGFGLSGAVAAGLIAEWLPWRETYLLGGFLGLLLLFLRFRVSESHLFSQIKVEKSVKRGNILQLLYPPKRFLRYLSCVLIAVPIWYCAGILMTFAPEIGTALGAQAPLSAGRAILFSYVGVALGDVASGVLSQILKSRKRVVAVSLALEALLVILILSHHHPTPQQFYALAFLIGLATGYWAVFITLTSEHFGTNLRATATTSAPNLVRASVVPMTLSLTWLKPHLGLLPGVILIGISVFVLATVALVFLEETYSKDLNYLEK